MKNKERIIIILIVLAFLAGIVTKVHYISYTDVWERQHDVIGFGADEGQAAYIEYILNNKALPDFDPRTKWGFFQPPLHHILSALTIFISTKLGANYGRATENIQYLTCFYMIAIMIMMVIIFLKAEKNYGSDNILTIGLFTTICVAGIHPIFTLLSGSINNDALSLVLAVCALLFTIKWYEYPGYIKIIHIGFAIGLSMMAKLTGGLIAVPVAILFLLKLIQVVKALKREKKDELVNIYQELGMRGMRINDCANALQSLVEQFLIFAAIVFPTGLWWTVRNARKWDMPINYIPGVGEQIPDTVSTLRRIFDVSMKSVYCSLINAGDSFDEFNIPLACVKTSLFGEWNFAELSNKLKYVAWPLFVLAIVLIIFSLIATFYMTFSKNSQLKIQYRVALFATWAIYLIAYLSFALSYRNFSAQDFRYGAICILCEGIFLGLFTDKVKSKIIKYSIVASAAMFGICSFMAYLIIGLKS